MNIKALLLTAALICLPNAASAWSLDEMNKTIDQTNFVLNKGCSGTLISISERLILTAFHCIEDNIEAVEQEVTNADGWVKKVKVRRYQDVPVEQSKYEGYTRSSKTEYVAKIIAEDKKRDLALVQISGPIPHTIQAQFLPVNDPVIRGEQVFAVGNPLHEDNTVVEGIVSNVNRTIEFPWTGGEQTPIIQFSGGLIGGNSGGALYNTFGQLIGVPVAGYRSATFIGFATPITTVRSFLKDNCFKTDFTRDKDCLDAKKKKSKDD